MVGPDPTRRTRPMPHVASPSRDLLARLGGIVQIDGDRLVDRGRGALPRRGHPRPGVDRRLRRATRRRSRPPSGSSGRRARPSARDRRASTTCTWPAPGARSTGFTVPAINIRAQTFDMARTIFEAARGGRRRRGHPRACAERADLHLPAPDRLRDGGPRRGDRGELAGPVFIQGDHYQFNAKKYAEDPGGDDRGDPARLPPRDRRRLPEHRHRLVDARRPVEADARRAAARELRRAPRS